MLIIIIVIIVYTYALWCSYISNKSTIMMFSISSDVVCEMIIRSFIQFGK